VIKLLYLFNCRVREVDQLDDLSSYLQKLVACKKFVQLESIRGVYAIVDEKQGLLSNKWLLVEEREFVDGQSQISLLACDCAI
jgi:hypothetical protein